MLPGEDTPLCLGIGGLSVAEAWDHIVKEKPELAEIHVYIVPQLRWDAWFIISKSGVMVASPGA